eukprot:UN12333
MLFEGTNLKQKIPISDMSKVQQGCEGWGKKGIKSSSCFTIMMSDDETQYRIELLDSKHRDGWVRGLNVRLELLKKLKSKDELLYEEQQKIAKKQHDQQRAEKKQNETK